MPTNYRHEAIIDMMIAAPKMTKGEIALELGYTQPWLSTLINSDAFQMRLAERRAELSESLGEAATQRLHELDELASKIIKDELAKEDADPLYALNVKKVLQPAMTPKKDSRLSQLAENLTLVQNNTQINQSVLERARNKMRLLESRRQDDDDSLVSQVLA